MNSNTFDTSSTARKTSTYTYTRNRLLWVKAFSLLYTYPNSMKNEPGFKKKIPWPIYPRISQLKFPAMSVYHHSLNGRTHMHPGGEKKERKGDTLSDSYRQPADNSWHAHCTRWEQAADVISPLSHSSMQAHPVRVSPKPRIFA